jgi:hypothetical protein
MVLRFESPQSLAFYSCAIAILPKEQKQWMSGISGKMKGDVGQAESLKARGQYSVGAAMEEGGYRGECRIEKG